MGCRVLCLPFAEAGNGVCVLFEVLGVSFRAGVIMAVGVDALQAAELFEAFTCCQEYFLDGLGELGGCYEE